MMTWGLETEDQWRRDDGETWTKNIAKSEATFIHAKNGNSSKKSASPPTAKTAPD